MGPTVETVSRLATATTGAVLQKAPGRTPGVARRTGACCVAQPQTTYCAASGGSGMQIPTAQHVASSAATMAQMRPEWFQGKVNDKNEQHKS